MRLPINNPHTAFWALGKGTARELKDEITENYIEACKNNGLSLYYTVNELGGMRNERGHLRDARNVVRFTALFADFDKGEKIHQMEIIESLNFPPSTIVESGRGYHAYWEVDEQDRDSIEPLDWQHAQKSLAKRVGADLACTDPARLMRLPGSWHVKDGFEPSRVRIVEDRGTTFRWSELQAQFGGVRIPMKMTTTPYGRPLNTQRYVPRLPSLRLSEGERHGALIKYGARLFNGVAPIEVEERRQILKAWYVDSCMKLKDQWEHEVDSYVDDWLLRREFKGVWTPKV